MTSTAETPKVLGGCLCGAIRYEADRLDDASYCHCRMCQKATGGPFALFASFKRAGFRFTKGGPKIYRSSSFAERGFCGDCGTPLTFDYVSHRDSIGITVGSLDQPAAAKPSIHWGIESALPWLIIDDELPRKRTEDDPAFDQAKAGKPD